MKKIASVLMVLLLACTLICVSLSPAYAEGEINPDPIGPVESTPTVPVTTQPPTEPTTPSTEPTTPSTEPTAPSTDPTAPSTQPTAPSTEPTVPSTAPTTPTAPSTEPVSGIPVVS